MNIHSLFFYVLWLFGCFTFFSTKWIFRSTITVFSILFVILLCKNFAEYYSNKNDDDNSLNQNYKDILLSATNYLFVVASSSYNYRIYVIPSKTTKRPQKDF